MKQKETDNRRKQKGSAFMLKTLGAQIKEYKKASIATPFFMIGEVIMETIIPLLMALLMMA